MVLPVCMIEQNINFVQFSGGEIDNIRYAGAFDGFHDIWRPFTGYNAFASFLNRLLLLHYKYL